MDRRELLGKLLSAGVGAGALWALPAGCGPKNTDEPVSEEQDEVETEEYYRMEEKGGGEEDVDEDEDDGTASEGE